MLDERWGGGRGRVGDIWRSVNFGGFFKGGNYYLKEGLVWKIIVRFFSSVICFFLVFLRF